MKPIIKERLLPMSLTAIIILTDQIIKAIIVKVQPFHPALIKDVFNNDFLWIYHVRNKAIAFSMGENLPEFLKPIVFIVFPLLVLGFLMWYFFKSDEFTTLQRWAAAGIIGGGIGNLIDRIFRPDGVVDFISVNIYGLFGMQRWPTFNIADASVVVCCIILLITLFISTKKINEKKQEPEVKQIEEKDDIKAEIINEQES
ncbi:MAG: signal peptidase II [Treponema sp.]|nr:signal peptidase II [Treponema sp.]MCL2250853.1 signal peptidase II [Treponema sp.]